MPFPWPPASATGVGPMPGDDPRAATRIAFDACPSLPFVPWLPEAGVVGCDFAGRGAALLVDLHVDLQPSGWRLVPRPGVDERRARDWLVRSLDALEETAGGWEGPVKVSVPGPWSLAATLELARGDKAVADGGAVRDLAAALAEGVAIHVDAVRRAVPGATDVVVQLDEPLLAAVLAGRIATQSGWSAHPAIEAPVAEAHLGVVLAAGGPHAGARLEGAPPPIGVVHRAGAAWVGLDLGPAIDVDLDAVGEAVDGGRGLVVGLATADPALRLWSALGFAGARLPATVVVTPPGALDRGSLDDANRALRRAAEVADELAERSA
jgi:hypothetical protein